MHWSIAAPFFEERSISEAVWLDDFIDPKFHTFTKVPRRRPDPTRSWHHRASRNTTISGWSSIWTQASEAWQATKGGVITVFPQLAVIVGLKKQLSRRKTPVVAWCFNVGALYEGARKSLARLASSRIDHFVVHSRKECETVSQWLGLPQDRFSFVPLQRAPIAITEREDLDHPFILSMGSANRDYATFFEAVKKLGYRTLVVASSHSIKGLEIPPNVELLPPQSHDECHRLAQRARLNVVPLIEHHTAAGQVTIIEAQRMRRPVISTRSPGSEDYVDHGKTGILVAPGAVDELAREIDHLWNNQKLRDSLSREAGRFAEEQLSDEVAGDNLKAILDRFG
jgi:glycosyltransferase involved in cell wall biosynthesis